MPHDAARILMGTTQSNVKEVQSFNADPTVILAGLCAHLKSDGTLTLAVADGAKLGISLGADLSGTTKRTAICRKGLLVPIHLTDGLTPTKGAQVQISTTTGKAVSSGTAVNAVYATSTITGVTEAGADINVALIDFPGGL